MALFIEVSRIIQGICDLLRAEMQAFTGNGDLSAWGVGGVRSAQLERHGLRRLLLSKALYPLVKKIES